jgi:hypothetical protein
MEALTIIGCVFGGVIILTILIVLVGHIPDWHFRRWEKRDAYSQLLAIKSKGYSWAIIPRNKYDYDARNQFSKNNIYVQAKKSKVDFIGRLPDGDFIYLAQDGERFNYYDRNVTSVLIDSAQNVYIPAPKGSELIDNRLVVLGADLIIPDNYHIINDPLESKDFLKYHYYLSTYFGDNIPYLYPTELRGPKET